MLKTKQQTYSSLLNEDKSWFAREQSIAEHKPHLIILGYLTIYKINSNDQLSSFTSHNKTNQTADILYCTLIEKSFLLPVDQ